MPRNPTNPQPDLGRIAPKNRAPRFLPPDFPLAMASNEGQGQQQQQRTSIRRHAGLPPSWVDADKEKIRCMSWPIPRHESLTSECRIFCDAVMNMLCNTGIRRRCIVCCVVYCRLHCCIVALVALVACCIVHVWDLSSIGALEQVERISAAMAASPAELGAPADQSIKGVFRHNYIGHNYIPVGQRCVPP